MRLLLEIQYYKILFAAGANISELLASIDGAKVVNEKGGYGEPRLYTPVTDIDIIVKLIPNDLIGLPENKDTGLEQYHKIKSENEQLRSKVYELESQIKNIASITNKEE